MIHDTTEAYNLIAELRAQKKKKKISYEKIAKILKEKGLKTKHGKDFNGQNVYMVSKVYKKPPEALRAAPETAPRAHQSLDKQYLRYIITNMETSLEELKKLL